MAPPNAGSGDACAAVASPDAAQRKNPPPAVIAGAVHAAAVADGEDGNGARGGVSTEVGHTCARSEPRAAQELEGTEGSDPMLAEMKQGVSPVSFSVAADSLPRERSLPPAPPRAAPGVATSSPGARSRRKRAAFGSEVVPGPGDSHGASLREQPSVICTIIPTPSWRCIERPQKRAARVVAKEADLRNPPQLKCGGSCGGGPPRANARAQSAQDTMPFRRESSSPIDVDADEDPATPRLSKTLAAVSADDGLIDAEDLGFVLRHNANALEERRLSAFACPSAACATPSRSPTIPSAHSRSTVGSPTQRAISSPVNPSALSKKRSRVYQPRDSQPVFPTPLECVRSVVHTERAHQTGESAAEEARAELSLRVERAELKLRSMFKALLDQLPSSRGGERGNASTRRVPLEDDVAGCVSDAAERVEHLIKRQRRQSEKSLEQAAAAEQRKLCTAIAVRDGLPERLGVVTIPAGYRIRGTSETSLAFNRRVSRVPVAQNSRCERDHPSLHRNTLPSGDPPNLTLGVLPSSSPALDECAESADAGVPKATVVADDRARGPREER